MFRVFPSSSSTGVTVRFLCILATDRLLDLPRCFPQVTTPSGQPAIRSRPIVADLRRTGRSRLAHLCQRILTQTANSAVRFSLYDCPKAPTANVRAWEFTPDAQVREGRRMSPGAALARREPLSGH